MATNRSRQRLRLDPGAAAAQRPASSAGEAVITVAEDGSTVIANSETGIRFDLTADAIEMSSPGRTLRIARNSCTVVK